MPEKKCKHCAMMIPKDAKICPYCRKKLGWTLPAKIGVVILALWGIGIAMKDIGKDSSTSPPSPHSLSQKEEALAATKLDFKWTTTGFDTIMEADFTVDNQSKYDIKDLTITCTHFSKSKTKIDSNTRTIYDVVKAKSKKMFPKFNMGFIHSQADSSICKITNLEIN